MRRSKVMGCWNDTVKQALAVDGSLRYQRTPLGSIVDTVQPRFPELLWMASRGATNAMSSSLYRRSPQTPA
jgi:hypothetical protein